MHSNSRLRRSCRSAHIFRSNALAPRGLWLAGLGVQQRRHRSRLVSRLLAWSFPASQVRRSHSPRVRRFPLRVRGGKHSEEHEEYRNTSPSEQKERTTPVAPEFTPVRDLVFSPRLVEGLTEDFTPSRARGNRCFIDRRLFYRAGFCRSNGLLLIFLCHFRPPARYSPRTQWAPGRAGPQPPTPPPAARPSRSTAYMADEMVLLQVAESGAVDRPALAPIGFGVSTSREDENGRGK